MSLPWQFKDAGMGASLARSWEGRSSTVMHVFVVLQPPEGAGRFPQGLEARSVFRIQRHG
jgi:hypothetical protein